MTNISRISCEQAKQLIDAGNCQLVDIRDPMSFDQYHLSDATRIDNDTLPNFIASSDKQAETLIFCYHGNSSQQAAAFFMQQGFTKVHSIDGGMDNWRQLYPDTLTSA